MLATSPTTSVFTYLTSCGPKGCQDDKLHAYNELLLNIIVYRQVKGCPLKVTVTSTVDASKVVCSGDGLKWGIIGKEIKSFIDTRKSGSGNHLNYSKWPGSILFIIICCLLIGELTAHCVGPHKVAFCELFDHRDGTYSLNINPQEHGRHCLTIKYGGNINRRESFFIK